VKIKTKVSKAKWKSERKKKRRRPCLMIMWLKLSKGRGSTTPVKKHLPEAWVPLSWDCCKDQWFLLWI
jgi:hypothetical protein